MVETIEKKQHQRRTFFNISKGIFNFIIGFILLILIIPKANESRIIQPGLYSITAKFKKSNPNGQKVLFGSPQKIKINNGTLENYVYNKYYNLTEDINIVEYFWENVNITDCVDMFHSCINLIEIDFSNFNTSNVTNIAGMFDGCIILISLNLSIFI